MVTVSFMSFLWLGFAQGRLLKFDGLSRAKPHVLRDDAKKGQMIRHKYQCQDRSLYPALPYEGAIRQVREDQTGIFRPYPDRGQKKPQRHHALQERHGEDHHQPDNWPVEWQGQ